MTRTSRLAAVLFGVGMLALQPFYGLQNGVRPAAAGYDLANRLYAVVLLALVWLLVLLRRRAGGVAATVTVAAAAVTAAGVVLEFYVGLLQSRPLSEDAHRAGQPASAVWWGSDGGFYCYALGALVLAVAAIVWAVRAGRRGLLSPPVAVALGLTGPLVLVDWALTEYGPLVAGLGGAAIAVPWLVAVGLDRRGGADRPATGRRPAASTTSPAGSGRTPA